MRTGAILLVAALCAVLPDLAPAQSLSEARHGNADPYEVLSLYYDALGGLEQLKADRPYYYEGTLELATLSGTIRHWSAGPGVYRTEVDLGVLKQTSGSDGVTLWEVDSNGKVTIVRDEASLTEHDLTTRMERFEHMDEDSRVFVVSYEGLDSVRGNLCHVVRIGNTLDQGRTLFYIDARDHLLRKTSRIRNDRASETFYSDYRDAGGILEPFREELRSLETDQVQTITISSHVSHESMPDSLFSPPEEGAPDFAFTDGGTSVEIPFRFIERHIFLPVTMECTERLWVLDSGAGMSVIDTGYAEFLGLVPEGQMKGLGAGKPVDVSFVTMPAFSVPGVGFAPQQAATMAISDLFKSTSDLEIGGILGFDFMSRFVTRIDYANSRLTLFLPDSFGYDGDGTVLDAPLSDNTFGVEAVVDGEHRGEWTIDLGASGASFHYPYSRDHGFVQREGIDIVGFGAGGRLEGRLMRFESMNLAGYVVEDPVLSCPVNELTGALGRSERIGNLGNSLLRRFVIYLDYERQQVIVERGDDFNAELPIDRSGLQLWRPDGDHIEVLHVADGTPAADAGLAPGDVVGSLNGIGARHFDLISIRQMLREPAGTEYEIGVLRDGAPRTVRLVLRDIL